MLFNIKHKKLLSAFILLSGLIFSLQSFVGTQVPKETVRLKALQDITVFKSTLDTLQIAIQNKADIKRLQFQFKQTRLAFKKFEWLLEYFDSGNYRFFNGTNAVEFEYGYQPNMQPEGLQSIETLFYADSLQTETLLLLVNKLKYKTLTFYSYFTDAELKDDYIFSAIRYHLIRIEALNLASFDSPDLQNNTQEITVALSSLLDVVSAYENKQNLQQIKLLRSRIQLAVKYLQTKNFNTLDRITFLKKYFYPLVQAYFSFLKAQQFQFGRDYTGIIKPVNLQKENIYDTYFLIPKYFAQDKYYTDDTLLIQLGKKLFFDQQLSADGKLSCASCHQPEYAFADKEITSITNQKGIFQKRNTPSLLNAALQPAYMYDMRANSLESQIHLVVSNPQEFNHTFDSIISRLKKDDSYDNYFNILFGKYGAEKISTYTINTAIAAFERELVLLNSPFDKYMRGESTNLSDAAKRGFNLFMGKAKCGTCHFPPVYNGLNPPYYTTMDAEVTGALTKFDTLHPVLDGDTGVYRIIKLEPFMHAFKTLTVRNTFLTPPYFHNGGILTLPDLIDFYNRGGGKGMGLQVDNQTLSADRLHLSYSEVKDLIAFIKSLTDTESGKP